MIQLVRCDDRLIHGQCMTDVVRVNDITNIIVIDDFTASNPVLKMIFENAVPKTMKASVYSLAEAVAVVKKAVEDDSRTLILMKVPQTFVQLRREVAGLPDSLNIGPVSSKENAKEATPFAFLLPEEAAACKELAAQGVEIYFKQTSNNKTTPWKDVADRF